MIVGEKLLSVREVADWLGVSQRTIFNLMERKAITGMRVGTRWRFDPAAIRDYLARKGPRGSVA